MSYSKMEKHQFQITEIINKYLQVEIMHTTLIQYNGNYIEVEKLQLYV